MNLTAPFPYFGGKRRIAAEVWAALGDVRTYVEPFAGSAAVLLARPADHARRCETVNDADGFICNFWRAVAADPAGVERECDWPVNELDLHARHAWLIGQREDITEKLRADPAFYDVRVAGWWVWGACLWIGTGWGASASQKLPHLGNDGCGVHRPSRQLPHLGDDGRGIHRPDTGRGSAFDESFSGGNREWFAALCDRLRRVRVACGNWSRVMGDSVLNPCRDNSACGVFLDPPYAEGNGRYAVDSRAVSADVAAWCRENGDDKRLRIALCGYEGEHDMPPTWRVVAWKTKGGYSARAGDNANQHRERLWLSPGCIDATRQLSLLGLALTTPSPSLPDATAALVAVGA